MVRLETEEKLMSATTGINESQIRSTTTAVRNFLERIASLPHEDVEGWRSALRRALQEIEAAVGRSIQRGAWVSFATSRVPERLVGTVTKVNAKTVTIRVAQPKAQAGRTWRVSPSLLTIAEPIEMLRIDQKRVLEIASEACAEERFGAADCEPTHLVERGGLHLVFVETPAHGYFVVVEPDGVARIVGEEDCGIQDMRVRRHFGIGAYAEEYMPWV
jgi:hypothetical protein